MRNNDTDAMDFTGPYSQSAADVLQAFGVARERGLTTTEVHARRERHGANELKRAPVVPWWTRWLSQFRGLVIWILIAAAIIAALLGERSDAWVILAIVVLNAVLGFVQEEKAARALESLQNFTPPLAKVVRDGAKLSVEASGLVPGDIVELESGDIAPADGRLLDSYALFVQEAPLTGESAPVEKDARSILPMSTALGDRNNMIFHGTHIAAGKATAVITSTGMRTELGRIAGMLERLPRKPTPLERRLEELGRVLIVVCLTLVAVVFVLQMLRGGHLLDVFFLSVSLAVAAVPEGLPAVVTICLALGVQRMVKRNALVRKLPSVETLGTITVICSDKTGTLTRNEMTVERAWAGDMSWRITGSGYQPQGEFIAEDAGAPTPNVTDDDREDLRWLLTIGTYCNNAALVSACDSSSKDTSHDRASPEAESGWKIVGDPTEGALLVAALKAHLAQRPPHVQPLLELPFDADRRRMSVAFALADQIYLFTKGAPESVLAKCTHIRCRGRVEPFDEHRKSQAASVSEAWASQALRVLGLAYRKLEDVSDAHESRLVFAGLVGMIDPPRDEVYGAIARCRTAGVRAIMITGDHPQTAEAIARQLSLQADAGRTLTGRELDELSDESLREAVRDCNVYARVSAGAKLRIVSALKARGHIVAMTGDGVNDAPAVKRADIGIAMGITGTDVTKAAADLVLVDDNFATIVNAIEEGRGIFDNIQKIIHYLLSCNAGEVLFMFLASLMGWPLPLEAIQILWINLVTDGLPALALAMEPTESDVMQRPPRPEADGVLTVHHSLAIVLHGLLIAATAAAAFWYTWRRHADPQIARTTAFCVLAFSQLFYSFGCRSRRSTFFELRPWSNPSLLVAIAASAVLQTSVVFVPPANQLLRVTGPETVSWFLIVATSLVPVTVIELLKLATTLYQRLCQSKRP